MHTARPLRADDAKLADKISFRFATPTDVFYDSQPVEMVTVPGITGEFGIMPRHVPTIAQLRPGVVQVKKDGAARNFFVSGGFCVVKDDSSVAITAAEALPLEDIDAEAVHALAKTSDEAVAKAANEREKAVAQIRAEAIMYLKLAVDKK